MDEQDKINVLSNIASISAEELFFQYIRTGKISLDEMMNTGQLVADKRITIVELIAREEEIEEEAWNRAESEASVDSYNKYLSNFPNGKYVVTAESSRDRILQNEKDAKKRKDDILDKIKHNSNGYTPKIINDYIDRGYIEISDLRNIDIPESIIAKLSNYNLSNLDIGKVPERIPDGYTEVYFWGSPGSGKTCALAGILSYMDQTGVFTSDGGSGYHYMNQLKNTFSKEIGNLPQGTPIEVSQYLPFRLTDHKGEKHPIALIELSGEIFECYYRLEGGLELISERHTETFNKLKTYLSGSNRKVHFFVIDLSKDPSDVDDQVLRISDYLDAAQKYFTRKDIFKKTTDAIYIIATKSDLLNCTVESREEESKKLLNSDYTTFVNVLKDACKKYKINDRNELKVIPFSLGKVYFNYICQFNDKSSSQIVEVLRQKTEREAKRNFLGKIFNW